MSLSQLMGPWCVKTTHSASSINLQVHNDAGTTEGPQPYFLLQLREKRLL
jgi:hypothetical protein